jgi:hypothetical protein
VAGLRESFNKVLLEENSMEIKVSENVIETVCNSLRASKHSLQQQLASATSLTKKDILKHQLNEVEEALCIFDVIS